MSGIVQTFDAHLADAQMQVATAGFNTGLWTPEFGWRADEAKAAEDAHMPQLLAAFQCFLWFFVAEGKKAWVHLAAEMQAGKTGVVTALVRLVFANARTLGVLPDRVFVITGMNDLAWVKQTKERLPNGMRSGVAHNGGLAKIVRDLKNLAEHADGLRNVLVVVDESHIATNVGNRPNRMVYDLLATLCPPEFWTEHGIRVLTISATDPAKVAVIQGGAVPSRVVRLLTNDAYQSVATLNAAGRVRHAENFGDLHTDKAIAEVARAVREEFPEPLYHLLRCKNGKAGTVEAKLRAAVPDCDVIHWNASERPMVVGEDGSSSMMKDINDHLVDAPRRHTFFLLKNMFYAAKTMKDMYVGILYDRVGGKDDTNLQSLLGRACGYNRSVRTVIYTSRQTVENYLNFWQEVISGQGAPPTDIPVERLDKKMAGVRIVGAAGGCHAMHTTHLHAAPGGRGGGGGGGDVVAPRAPRRVLNEAHFTAEWREFPTLAAAKAFGKGVHTPSMEGEFYKCCARGKHPEIQRYDTIIGIQGEKTTARGGNVHEMAVGESQNRIFVGYKDMADPASAVWFIKRITRVAV